MHKKWHLTFIKHEMQIKFINFCNLTIQNTFRHFNTVCQQKGPLAKHENCKIPKPFQEGLEMLVFSNFALQKNYPKNSVLTTFLHLDGQLGSQESMNEKSTDVCQPSWRKGTFRRHLFELLFEKNYEQARATQPKFFGPKVILPTTPLCFARHQNNAKNNSLVSSSKPFHALWDFILERKSTRETSCTK